MRICTYILHGALCPLPLTVTKSLLVLYATCRYNLTFFSFLTGQCLVSISWIPPAFGKFLVLYNLYSFVWIQPGCLANTVFTLNPSNSVIKKLRCAVATSEAVNILQVFYRIVYRIFGKIAKYKKKSYLGENKWLKKYSTCLLLVLKAPILSGRWQF